MSQITAVYHQNTGTVTLQETSSRGNSRDLGSFLTNVDPRYLSPELFPYGLRTKTYLGAINHHTHVYELEQI